jgi:hypothetical protein
MNNKKHLTKSGLIEIVSRKFILNKGLNENLKAHFLDVIIPVERPLAPANLNLSTH